MAFVTCSQHRKSQDAQDEKIKSLENGAISAEDSLLDKTSGNVGGKITTGKIKEAIAGDVAIVLGGNAGIIGNGTHSDPLRLNLSDEFELHNGKLYLKYNEPKAITDLNNLSEPLRKLGFTAFSGEINNVNDHHYVVGIMPNFNDENPQTGTTLPSQLAPDQHYDFNGWQLASSKEVQQFISNNGITWERSNDAGMKPDGSLNNPAGWTNWKRTTNVNITASQVSNLVEQLRGLTERLATAESTVATQAEDIDALKNKVSALELPCEVQIEHVTNHTVTDEDNVIVSSGGTITFPNNLKVGRSFTVIREGNGEVTLTGTMLPPNSKISGDGAVTAIVTAQGTVRVFGAIE